MKFDEKILWAVGALVLVALVIFHRPPKPGEAPESASPVADVGESFTPYNTNMTKGPAYLTYNQPWAFHPPIGNILPTMANGEGSVKPSPFATRNAYCETC